MSETPTVAADRFYITTNPEYYSTGPFDTRQEAIDKGNMLWPGRQFNVGKAGVYEPFAFDLVEELIELEACLVHDECGSGVDEWPPQFNRRYAEVAAANVKIKAILMELCGPCRTFPITDVESVGRVITESGAVAVVRQSYPYEYQRPIVVPTGWKFFDGENLVGLQAEPTEKGCWIVLAAQLLAGPVPSVTPQEESHV